MLRPLCNMCFQFSIITAYFYASKAGLNQGIITALFATYCIFTSVIFRFLFKEKLELKFLFGIFFMMTCVAIISLQSLDFSEGLDLDAVFALSFGLLAPFLISVSISISRYWTVNYNYKSFDFTIDTFLTIALYEIGFFIHANEVQPYTFEQLSFGIAASVFQITGTLLMIYAATYGLAGPASAMVQSQCVIHTILVAVFLEEYPTILSCIGILCAIIGAIIMTVDFSLFQSKEEFDEHLIEHSKSGKTVCDQCSTFTANKSQLSYYMV